MEGFCQIAQVVHGCMGGRVYWHISTFIYLFISFFHLIKGKKGVASDKCVDYRITSFLDFCLFLSRKVKECISPTLSVTSEGGLTWRGRSPAWRGRSSITLLSTDWGLERI